MPNVSDFTADLSRFPRWVDLDPSSFAFCETSAQINLNKREGQTANAQAKGMTGDVRKQFMSSCLSNKPAVRNQEAAMRQRQAVRQFLHHQG